MTTRPTQLPEWATSGVNVVEPPSGKKSAGWLFGERPPPPWLNWWKRLTGEWVRHIDELVARCIEGAGGSVTLSSDKLLWRAIRQTSLIEAAMTSYRGDTGDTTRLLQCGLAFMRTGTTTPHGYLLVGSNTVSTAFIAHSYDWGRNWTPHTAPTVPGGVAFFLLVKTDLILLVTSGGTQLFGTDPAAGGTTWTARTQTVSSGVQDGAVLPGSNGNVVLIRKAGNTVHYSTDGAANNWSAGTMPVGFTAPQAVAAGAGVFVMVDSGGKRIATSPTGQTWTVQTPPVDASTDYLDVEWVRSLGLFVALAKDGTNTRFIHTSPDGVNWTSRGQVGGLLTMRVVGTPYGAVVAGRYNIVSSIDGIVWADLLGAANIATPLNPFHEIFGFSVPPVGGAALELGLLCFLPSSSAPNYGKFNLAGPIQ